MARIMLNEHNTPDRFWADAINTACGCSICISFSKRHPMGFSPVRDTRSRIFKVIDAKCFILDKHRAGIFLGYASNSFAHRVINNFTWKFEETMDVEFQESNSSKVEYLRDDVEIEIPVESLKNLDIGEN